MASFDEAWYAGIARNILRSGRWWTLEYNGAPFWHKPPLGIWLTAASFRLFGVGDFAARLPAILCGTACVLLVYRFARLTGDVGQGLLAALLLLTAQDFVRFSSKGQLEALVTLLLTAHLAAFWHGLERPVWHLAGGAFAGLAIATKNQVGLFGWVVQVVYMSLARDGRPLRQWQWFAAIPLGLLLGCVWFLEQYLEHGSAFVDEWWFANFGVYRDQRDIGGSLGFYLSYLAQRHNVLLATAAAGLVWTIVQNVRGCNRLSVLLTAWMVTIPAICIAAGTRHYWYLVPSYPAVGLLGAAALGSGRWWRRSPRAVLAIVAGWAVAFNVSYYLPPPKEEIARATRELAPIVQTVTALDQPVYLLEHVDPANRDAMVVPGAHYYFDRVAHPVAGPDRLVEVLQVRHRVVGLVHRRVFEEIYRPLHPGIPFEQIAESGPIRCYRISGSSAAGAAP